MNAEPPFGDFSGPALREEAKRLELAVTTCEACGRETLSEPLTHSRWCNCNIKASRTKERPRTCGRLPCMMVTGEMRGVGAT